MIELLPIAKWKRNLSTADKKKWKGKGVKLETDWKNGWKARKLEGQKWETLLTQLFLEREFCAPFLTSHKNYKHPQHYKTKIHFYTPWYKLTPS